MTLRFPGNRLAQFIVSYYANRLDSYVVMGTKGSIQMSPGYMYGMKLEQSVVLGESKAHESYRSTDHFGGELAYFSRCILDNHDPEPDGEEGYADVRVLEGIVRALETGQPQVLAPFTRARRIDTAAQKEMLRAKSAPDLVHASNPGRDTDKAPAN